MKQINKKFLIFLKNYFNCSENELMNNLKKIKCKKKYYCNYSFASINKDEFYYILIKNNLYHVVFENTILTFSCKKSKNDAYIYDYFLTEQEMRREKLIQIQQVSSNLLY